MSADLYLFAIEDESPDAWRKSDGCLRDPGICIQESGDWYDDTTWNLIELAETRVIDAETIDAVLKFCRKNDMAYGAKSALTRVCSPENLRTFLEEHTGKRVALSIV